ncbi:MAG: prepilin-type N-terminal cleavage/methylation domain-containing protein [Gammaproteobacteria bacterium]|nr:prepilin-type N-terminal cleavage/methylation domain-containing protein [Gammaproteobacteria bacterium]
MNKALNQKGFTLIEIAIVLVIIGLLLGGVLKGQELINTARVRALNNTVDGITAAWFSFQDRYRAFPGDYTQASVNLPGLPTNGDGNGLVGNVTVGPATPEAERAMVWMHLQSAGYITGGYDVAAAVVAQGDEYACPVTVCPDNGFGAGMNLNYGALRQAAGGNAHELITGRGIPVEVLAELDRKVDDGEAGSGAMQLGQAGTNWGGGTELTDCQGAVVGSYELLNPSSNCAAVFRNF